MLPIQRQISAYNFHGGNAKKYIAMHDVGRVSTAKNNVDYFGGGDRGASAHYFVDDNSIWQSVEDNNCSWSVGDGWNSRTKTYYSDITNNNSIAIEMCLQPNGTISEKTIQNTVELVKYLQAKYGISNDRVVRHFDASGKICPRALSANGWAGWNSFKNRVNGGVATTPPTAPSGGFNVGSTVTVAQHAKFYSPTSGGKPIPAWVCGNQYQVLEIQNINYSNSKREFLLAGIMSWVLEQDLVGGQGAPQPNVPAPSNPAPSPSPYARAYDEDGIMKATERNWIKRTPTQGAPIMEYQEVGQDIYYHKVVWSDGLVWLQINSAKGGQAFVAYADANGTGFGRKYGVCS